MFGIFANSFFGLASEFFSIVGSILLYMLPLVIIFALCYSFWTHNYIFCYIAPFADVVAGKISLFLSLVADEIARGE